MFKIDFEKLKQDEELGTGTFGNVFPYRAGDSYDKWAVKYIPVQNFHDFQTVLQEIVLGFNHFHSSILPIVGFCIEEDKPKGWKIYIKMPRMEKSLRKVLQEAKEQSKELPKEQIIKYFYSITKGLEYLQCINIAHRDIKPENILLDKEGNPKICDIGIAKYKQPDNETRVTSLKGTPFYMAPEIFDPFKKSDPFKADLWSLGVLITELCLINPTVIHEHKTIEEKMQIARENNERVEKRYGKDLAEILQILMDINPDNRRSFAEILEMLKDRYIYLEEFSEDRNAKISIKNIDFVLKDLEKKWKNDVSFDFNGNLTIKPIEPSEFTNKKFSAVISDLSQKLKTYQHNLQQLSLDLSWTEHITTEGLRDLKQNFGGQLKKLKQFSLDFDGSQGLTDEGLKHIGLLCGSYMESLCNLSLGFYRCSQITHKGIQQLFSGLNENGRSLKQLSLNFSCCEGVNDETLNFIAATLGQNFTNLQAFSLNFGVCNNITKKGARQLAEKIGQDLKHLKLLSLVISGCKDIRDEDLLYVVHNISQKQPGLQKLSLDFRVCDRITDKGITDLSAIIRQYLPKLDLLNLDFSWCKEITDIGLVQLQNNLISDTSNLKSLTMSFAGCNKITLSGVENLQSAINQHLKELSCLSLDFTGCDQVEENKQIVIKKRF